MHRSTVYVDFQSPESATSSRTSSKPSTRAKNDQKWDAQKNEIYRFYIEEDNTLDATIQMIEGTSGFKARFVPSLTLRLITTPLLTNGRLVKSQEVEDEAQGMEIREEPFQE